MAIGNRKVVLFCMACMLLVVAGCTTSEPVDKVTAETNALVFVKDKVKFFSTDEGTSKKTNITSYDFSVVSSSWEDDRWIVQMQVSTEVEQEQKINDLRVILNGDGEPILFNGQAVPREKK